MPAPRPGDMIDVVQFERLDWVDDGFGKVESFAAFGAAQRARKIDASTREQWRASEVGASITARFQVYRNEITREITAKDRITCGGLSYNISGVIVMADDRRFLEITAAARSEGTG